MSIWSDIFGTRKFNAQFFAFTGNGDRDRPEFYINFDGESGSMLKAFYDCGVLHTVITRNAQAMANGKWWVIRGNDMTGEDVSKLYPNITALLAKPNVDQEWSELVIQAEVCRQVYGCVYFYASTPEGFNNAYADALWALSPYDVIINRDGSAIITLDDRTITVAADRLCEIKDAGQFSYPGSRHTTCHKHKSRIHSARHAIENIIQAEDAIYSINHDRGALGLLSVEDKDASGRIPLSPAERENIQRQMRQAYGVTSKKSKILITNAALRWQQMSMSVKDLMLIEGMNKNMETICNVFDYPKDLLVSDAKYSNKQVSKGHYEDAVIPFSQIYASKLSYFLGLRPGDNFVIDFSHVPAMKDAEEQKAKTYYQKALAVVKLYEDNILSREETRLEMGYEPKIEGGTMFNQNNNSNGGTNTSANQGS